MIEVLLEAERALSFGLLDQAERLYRQASDADPRNSIAVVGLARVALERGDEAGALAEAERALAIDNENEAARRLAERLREVRLHREAAAASASTAPHYPVATPEPAAPGDAAPVARPEPEPVTSAAPEPAQEPAARERPVLTPTTIRRSPEPVAPEPVIEAPRSAEAVEPAGTEPVDMTSAAPEPVPTPEPEALSEPGEEPRRRGGIIGWLLRLFGRG